MICACDWSSSARGRAPAPPSPPGASSSAIHSSSSANLVHHCARRSRASSADSPLVGATHGRLSACRHTPPLSRQTARLRARAPVVSAQKGTDAAGAPHTTASDSGRSARCSISHTNVAYQPSRCCSRCQRFSCSCSPALYDGGVTGPAVATSCSRGSWLLGAGGGEARGGAADGGTGRGSGSRGGGGTSCAGGGAWSRASAAPLPPRMTMPSARPTSKYARLARMSLMRNCDDTDIRSSISRVVRVLQDESGARVCAVL
jgi:hypothetical protein